ncbi:MAG: NADH:ubiquinone reductase (Na(+)-transporting) subunit A [Ignavibacteriae bacterium HGW-Ignavibacteriae-2]|jgi:Na+-transporting NADH:ubiquinone oxidoreductase subunit A|nr:MAG: NADH:ubiquinone reductase (Na(+)-transporting) subunit A [Ignavibacteriae bacterium HGW-Ignavibacteriae-2]
MGLHKLKKGLDLPINGKPLQEVKVTKLPKKVALLGDDYVGMKPTMLVQVGDKVKLGQVLFTDKKQPEVKFTSPGSGTVVEINRGEKRVFKSIVIELQGSDEITFQTYSEGELPNLTREKIVEILTESGQWTALRSRPFSSVANPTNTPHSIFVTAMDTNPLAPDIEKVIAGKENNFINGLTVLSKLTDGKLYLCKKTGTKIPQPKIDSLVVEEFEGPHPSGNVGTHIHFIDPVGRKKFVWYINAQDVVSIGKLFTTGKIDVERVIALAGAAVKSPQLVITRVGAAISDITSGELIEGENRIISGSVLSGRTAANDEAYLGRFHQQISVIKEERSRHFLGWLSPGFNLYSIKNIVLSKLIPNKTFDFSTALHGGHRAIVPSGNFEQLVPLDIIPTYLLRSLAVNDVEEAEKLGLLELDEEDLALCTFSCPSKLDYGPMLRENLTIIEKEG